MLASTLPFCNPRAFRKQDDTMAKMANVAIKKIPHATITSMRLNAEEE
jgi:hypothetical protein